VPFVATVPREGLLETKGGARGQCIIKHDDAGRARAEISELIRNVTLLETTTFGLDAVMATPRSAAEGGGRVEIQNPAVRDNPGIEWRVVIMYSDQGPLGFEPINVERFVVYGPGGAGTGNGWHRGGQHRGPISAGNDLTAGEAGERGRRK